LDVPEGERPRSVSWLCELIAKEEGENAGGKVINGTKNFVKIAISDEAYGKLKELAKYYGTDVAEIASIPFKAALEVFLDEQKKKYRLTSFRFTNRRVKTAGGHLTGLRRAARKQPSGRDAVCARV